MSEEGHEKVPRRVSSSRDIKHGTVGVDSGGSLTKIVYFRPLEKDILNLPSYVIKDITLRTSLPGVKPDPSLEFESGVLKFIKIPRHKSVDFMHSLVESPIYEKIRTTGRLNITGGGAYRLAKDIKNILKMPLNQLDEFQTIIDGLNFLLDNVVADEVFAVDLETGKQKFGVLDHLNGNYYPYMLVNIGSGVSILKITAPGSFTRVSGSSVGGGTFLGLCRLLTKAKTFEEVQELSGKGNSYGVDLSVGDIYGHDSDMFQKLGLPPNIVASSFGKAATAPTDEELNFKEEDIAKSLLITIANNIGQIAYLNAKLHNCDKIFFVGGFIQQNPFLWKNFAYAIKFWSENRNQALFLRHDGYLGALGALLYQNSVTETHITEGEGETDGEAEGEAEADREGEAEVEGEGEAEG